MTQNKETRGLKAQANAEFNYESGIWVWMEVDQLLNGCWIVIIEG